MDNGKPGVGIGVIVVKDGKILVGKRVSSHGAETWCFPGGKLHFGESFEACAKREVFEEAGIFINNVKFITVTNDIFEKEGQHWITIFLQADYASGTVKEKEPNKMRKWQWVSWDRIPKPLFVPLANLKKTGYRQ